MINDTGIHKTIYTVSKLTAEIKQLLEDAYAMVWITGEISNFKQPVSGHFYFDLKDASARINGVMFRGQNRRLGFMPEDGMQVTGLGRVSVYEPRGSYQIILEHMEPRGVGALQVAFEQLKKRLGDEGLFDTGRKKSLPFLPEFIDVVTSATGAAVRDIINVISQRFPSVKLRIVPVTVQGDAAADEIAEALKWRNAALRQADVIILARGGGSLEDLQAFNTEQVARAISASRIPVVTGIGHETDFTIADFVADYRAPTPSAAAAAVVPDRRQLVHFISDLNQRLYKNMHQQIIDARRQLADLDRRLVDPRKKLADMRLRVDELTDRLLRASRVLKEKQRHVLRFARQRLLAASPLNQCRQLNATAAQLNINLLESIRNYLYKKRMRLDIPGGKLQALNPSAILARGYSITRTRPPQREIVKNAGQVVLDQLIDITLAEGSLTCRIEGKTDNGEKKL